MMRRLIDAAFERNYHWLVIKVYAAIWGVFFVKIIVVTPLLAILRVFIA